MKYHKLFVKVHAPLYGVFGLHRGKVLNEEVNATLHWLYKIRACLTYPGPEVIKLFFMLILIEYEISTAHKI